MNLPIEIINKILFYVGELNNDAIIMQYALNIRNKYYKINSFSTIYARLKALILMKRYYPLYNSYNEINNRILYKEGINHYEKIIREKKTI